METWEHRTILEGNKGTKTPPPPRGRTLKVVLLAKALFNSDIAFKMAFKQ